MSSPVDLAGVVELVELLGAVPELRSAAMDPAELTAPCAWVQLAGIAQPFLQGGVFRCRVHLIAGDTDGGPRAAAELVTMYNAVLSVLTPDGETVTETVQLPDGGTYPALMLPVDVPA